jgi:membrane protein YqaA with SNARE-associated domain
MKIRVKLWLTIFLFLMMVVASLASSYIGYFMGREALKVVTQPDVNSDNKNLSQKPVGGKHKGLKIIEEKKVLQEVYDMVNQKSN